MPPKKMTETKTPAAAVWLHVDDLTPWKHNPRKNDHAVERVARNIEALGFGAPIVARSLPDGSREVIAGHTRLKAMKWLAANVGKDFAAQGTPGPGMVPVRVLEHLTDDQAAALALADNKLSEMSAWDDGMLVEILRALEDGQKLNTGFSENEMERIFADSSPEEDEVDLSEPDRLLAKWGVKSGDLWVAGEQRVLCGDSRDPKSWVLLLGDDRATWMWTDPPYGVDYQGGTKKKLKIKNDDAAGLPGLLRDSFSAVNECLTGGASIYVSTPSGAGSLEFGNAFVGAGWKLSQVLVWLKDAMVLGHSDYHYRHEPILYGRKPAPGKWGRGGKAGGWHGDDAQTSVLEHAKPKRSEQHPTMKPVALVEQCLRNSTTKGDLGVEPFAGSGTTLVASQNLGRRCAAVEIDPKYVAVCIERLASMGVTPRRT